MRIVSVVSTYSDDGTSGGVIRVAIDHCRELVRLGHEATVVTGGRSKSDPVARSIEGVTVQAPYVRPPLRRLGERGHVGIRIYWVMWRHILRSDLVHIHLCRDFITTAAVLLCRLIRKPFVIQTHGMIHPRHSLRLFDRLLVVPALERAATVFWFTEAELGSLRSLAPTARCQRIFNGVRLDDLPPRHARADVRQQVVYCARLNERKRPMAFVAVARTLMDELPNATFVLAGPEESEAPAVLSAIEETNDGRLRYVGPLPREQALELIASSAVFLLPSIDEPFPVTLIESLLMGVPSVCTTSCGMADVLEREALALVVPPSIDALTGAARRVLIDQELATTLGQRARDVGPRMFDISDVVDELLRTYTRAVREGRGSNGL